MDAHNGYHRQCSRKEDEDDEYDTLQIDRRYVRYKMLPSIEYIVYLSRKPSKSFLYEEVDFCGFLLARKLRNLLYVDLVCSADRQGGVLLKRAEQLAREENLEGIALRVATPELMSYYLAKGYKRIANPCARSNRAALRALDDEHPYATEGSEVTETKGFFVNSVLKLLKVFNLWYGHGRWVAKCLN